MEIWNRLGTKIIPKLKGAGSVEIGVEFTVKIPSDKAVNLQSEVRQILEDLGIARSVHLEIEP